MKRSYTQDEYAQDELDILEGLYTKKHAENVCPKVNNILKVTIVSKNKDYIIVDYGSNNDGFILCKNETQDVLNSLIVGITIEAIVTEENNSIYGTLFSINEVHQRIRMNELIDSIGNKGVAYNCTVINLIPKVGYNVDIDGMKAFMPGSLASMNLLSNPESIVGTTLPVMVVNYMDNNTLVCSHKDYLEILLKDKIKNIIKGDKFEGTVTGVSDFGIFMQFEDCLTGMIHKTDLNEINLNLFLNKQISVGDTLQFAIKNIMTEKRIILTQLDANKDPWFNINEKYILGKKYQGKVIGIMSYGILVELEKNVRGLYVTENVSNYKVNETLTVKIKTIDTNNNKMMLY